MNRKMRTNKIRTNRMKIKMMKMRKALMKVLEMMMKMKKGVMMGMKRVKNQCPLSNKFIFQKKLSFKIWYQKLQVSETQLTIS